MFQLRPKLTLQSDSEFSSRFLKVKVMEMDHHESINALK